MATFEYIRGRYGSRKLGGRFVWLNYRYYLQTLEFELMDNGSYTFDETKADEDLNDPNTLKEVACGIIAAYIRNEHEIEPQQIFDDYYNVCFKSYVGEKKSDIEFRLLPDNDKELAFLKAMISDEQIRIGRSKALNDYLEENEQKGLALVGQHFMAFLHSRLQTFQTTPQPEADNPLFDKEALKGLFVEVFFANDYSLKDTYKSTIKQSRFDIFCSRLELVLNDTDKKPTKKDIGEIANMIYCSKFAKPDFKKPKREGEKGCFAHLIRTFFEIVKIDQPSDTSPNKYNNPTEDLINMFGDVFDYK